MKSKIMVPVLGLFLAVGVYQLSSNMDMDYATDAEAATATTLATVTCTDPTQAAFAPNLAYTYAVPAPQANGLAAAGGAGTAVISNAVNAEGNPTVNSVLNPVNATAGQILMRIVTPAVKLGGLLCQTGVGGVASMTAYGDGATTNDSALVDVAIGNLADADGTWTAADKLDAVLSTAPTTMFGTSGQVQAGISDASDSVGANDGEVVFGGGTETTGGSEMKVLLDASNANPTAAAGDNETFTHTLTPS